LREKNYKHKIQTIEKHYGEERGSYTKNSKNLYAVAKHPNWALSPKGVFDLKGGAIGFEDFPP
jgi:hypothetical protein